MNKIFKGSLLQFFYTPLALIWALAMGEDLNTISFATFLSLPISIIMFLYNFIVTFVFSKVLEKNNFSLFLSPFLILLVFNFKVQEIVQSLDFGGDFLGYIILTITFLVNIVTYFYVNKIIDKPEHMDILDN